MFPVLETERLILSEITEEDAEGIFVCLSNNDVTRYYGQENLESLEQAIKIVDLFANNYMEKRGIRWGIERKGTNGIIGTIGFNAWAPKHKRAEIGYEIIPEHWRKGYASEVVSKIVSYGFEVLDLTRIGAIVFTENEASNQLLTKMGFQKEGVLKDYMYQYGVPYDTNVYSILK
ncbi:GNAT family N-acetyltransferase [Paenibacillus sp. N3.4]|uniref:GNAT family N-acetyltransferase n=1 Tax=Paenibacillus sp. N3.4 TaxID=2603222 RepID=UPI0011C856CD|nr:GNAT family protein [Paenibacillus sp. N3.4]TXK77018.1 GNAT family N-acetyltransferase [Paenibacillus sp. N3.4]